MADKKDLTLAEQLVAKKAEYIEAKKRLYSNELANPHTLKGIKKDIARIMTQINAATETKIAKEGK